MTNTFDRLKTAPANRYAIEGQSGAGILTTAKAAARAGVAILTGVLVWGCGLLGPNDRFDVDASFKGAHDAGVCTFVFRAKATQPEETVTYTYKFRAMVLIAPETWAPLLPLEDGVGSFRDSLRVTWDASLGTQPEIGRFLRFHFTAGLFQLEDAITVMCPT